MTAWRAKHYSFKLSERRTVLVTLRRFRRGAPARNQHLVNITVGGVRQIVWELRVKRKHGKRARGSRPPKKLNEFLSTYASATLITVGLLGLDISTYQLLHQKSLEPHDTFTNSAKVVKAPAPLTLPRSIPTHLNIPSQNIDVDITPVDRDANGAIAMPPTLDWVTGWYDLSPTPGELGPSVIVGHVDTYEGISVFWNLRYVQPGDSVAVTRTDGRTANFVITALQQYDQHNFPTATVYGNTTDSELRLITCGGTFDTATGHYTENTVVYAKLTSVS